jgi:hypothetical protein
MNKGVTLEQATFVAKWWGNLLRDGASWDNGDTSLVGELTKFLAPSVMEDIRSGIIESQVEVFEDELKNIIVERNVRSLGVDYHPDIYLSEACEKADIDGEWAFPCKTNMVISVSDGTIKASVGYRRPFKQIYPPKRWKP